MPPVESTVNAEHEQLIAIPEIWLDECCGQVGLLHTLLNVLSGIEQAEETRGLIVDALDCCDSLRQLLNSIPVSASAGVAATTQATGSATSKMFERIIEIPFEPEMSGDNFPVFTMEIEDELPSFAEDRFEFEDESSQWDRLNQFHKQALGDLQELELLSIGHNWSRIARLAAGLKAAATHVSAYRLIVDAAALEAAAQAGQHHDVDLALEALRADLRACSRQMKSAERACAPVEAW